MDSTRMREAQWIETPAPMMVPMPSVTRFTGSENASKAAFAFVACLTHQCFEWLRR